MKNGFKPVYFIYLFALITILIVLAGVTESQAVVIFAVIAAIPGWGFMIFWQKIDNFKNRKFIAFQRQMIAKKYFFLGPLSVSSPVDSRFPNLAEDEEFLLQTETGPLVVRVFGPFQEYGEGIYYREVVDQRYNHFILCYEEASTTFGIFKPDQN